MNHLIKNNQNDISIVVERINASDRNIVMHFVDRQLKGINFWQGELDTESLVSYIDLNQRLYNFLHKKFMESEWWDNYEEFCYLHNSPDYWEILEWIDQTISRYLQLAIRMNQIEYKIQKQLEEKNRLQSLLK